MAFSELQRTVRHRLLEKVSDPVHSWPPDRRVDTELPPQPGILVVRTDRIGDAIISTPLLRGLRKRFPNARIDIVLGEKNAIVAPLLPYVDDVFVLGRHQRLRTTRHIRRRRYDLTLNLQLKPSLSATLECWSLGAAIVLEYPLNAPFWNPPENCRHMVAMTSRLLAPLGVPPLDDDDALNAPLEIVLPDASMARARVLGASLLGSGHDRARIFVNLSAGSHVRRPRDSDLERRLWPLEKVADLLIQLQCHKLAPILCGAPGDSPALDHTLTLAGGAAQLLPTTTSFPDFAAALTLADLIVSPDTSVTHLSAALGKPTVALFHKAENALTWGPWGVPNRIACSPAGIAAVEPQEVLAAVTELIEFQR